MPVRQPSGSRQPPPRPAGPDPAGSGRQPGARARPMRTIRTQLRSTLEAVIFLTYLRSNHPTGLGRRSYTGIGTPRGTSRRTRTAQVGRLSDGFSRRAWPANRVGVRTGVQQRQSYRLAAFSAAQASRGHRRPGLERLGQSLASNACERPWDQRPLLRADTPH
jgi:hypothetical protein